MDNRATYEPNGAAWVALHRGGRGTLGEAMAMRVISETPDAIEVTEPKVLAASVCHDFGIGLPGDDAVPLTLCASASAVQVQRRRY